MKDRKRFITILAAGLCVVLLCGVSFAAGSTTTKKTLEAYYTGIKLVVDGIEVTPKDANGKVVDPFVCDGTTYLPVRALANALGKEVDWDGETKTVYIGARPNQTVNWMKELPPYQVGFNCNVYDGSDLKKFFSVSGVKYTEGVALKSSGAEGYAVWNTNMQYSTMSFTIGHLDNESYANADTTLTIYLNNSISQSYDLKHDSPSQQITVSLNNAANVKLSIGKNSDPDNGGGIYKAYGIYNISFS